MAQQLKKPPSKKRYLKQMSKNMDRLDQALQGEAYPNLRKLFLTRKGKANSLYKKLNHLHSYLQGYEDDGLKRLEYIPPRGWEFMASLDTLVSLYKGNKETWRKALLKLSALQLIGQFKPRMDAEHEYLNSPAQQHSADRARQAAETERQTLLDNGAPEYLTRRVSRRPCTYYRLYPFTDKLLRIADTKAPAVKAMGNGIDKNAIRDIWGADQANRVDDTSWDIDIKTLVIRSQIRIELETQIKEKGYTTAGIILSTLLKKEASIAFGSKKRWRETWKAYKPILFEEFQLKEGQPSEDEKKKWGLMTNTHIIRRKGV